ncbi:Small subunit of serine palmitoyltransferase-like protein [Rutstroemia sp. NJR-2017a WRK4]|nr:Small subunit of serine palmitoyltransferase-like protein [Rutstroemia sp. NJR-2017a WRK4]
MSMFASTFRWLQRKRYHMIVIAMTLYLPQHITFLTNRAWFYYNGDESARSVLTSASPVIVETVKETIVKAAANGKEL